MNPHTSLSALYLVFIFQKVKDIETGKEWQSQQTTQQVTRKRPAEESCASETEPPKVVKRS